METIPGHKLSGDCYEILSADYPAEGFAFQAKLHLCADEIMAELKKVSKSVHRLTEYLTKENVAHNVYMTRGTDFENANSASYDSIRVFVWARKSVFGPKYATTAFQVAVCELSGQILCYEEDEFENTTEQDVMNALREACKNVKESVRPNVIDLFK